MRSFAHRRMPFALAIAALVCALAAASGFGATGNVAVSLNVASSTIIDLAGCPVGARAFGTVLPDTPATTSADCDVQFGASTTSHLRVRQSDGAGAAMYARSITGAGDPGFGTNGVSSIASGGGWLAGTHVLADGRVLRVGSPPHGSGTDWRVIRVDTNGTQDMTYAGDGRAEWNTGSVDQHPHVSALFPDGSIVVAGHVYNGSVDDATIVRFTANGILDTTWGDGDDGSTKFQPYPTASSEEVYDVEVLPDGSVLLSGMSYANRLWVARLDPDGILDPSFGGGDGVLVHDTGMAVDLGNLAVEDETGSIYWSGTAGGLAYVAKVTAAGVLDTSWGDAGVKAVNVPGTTAEALYEGFVDSQGRFVVIGDDDANAAFSFSLRLTAAGQPDASFGTGGLQTIDPFGAGEVWLDSGTLVHFEDDRYCTSGNGEPGGSWRFLVYCFDADGTLDEDFGGGDGYVPFIAGSYNSYLGGFDWHDGKLYVGGGSGGTLVTIRAGSDTTTMPDYVHATTTFASASGAFGACLRASTNATATWTSAPLGDCTGDGTHWNGIPRTTAYPGTEIATAAAGQMDAHALLRFGVRAPTAAKGAYVAPLQFEVVAP
jgi:uncharacterized delta-60 repeat protein